MGKAGRLARGRGRPRKSAKGGKSYRIQIRLGRRQYAAVQAIAAATDASTVASVIEKALLLYEQATIMGKRIIIEDPTGQRPPEAILVL